MRDDEWALGGSRSPKRDIVGVIPRSGETTCAAAEGERAVRVTVLPSQALAGATAGLAGALASSVYSGRATTASS